VPPLISCWSSVAIANGTSCNGASPLSSLRRVADHFLHPPGESNAGECAYAAYSSTDRRLFLTAFVALSSLEPTDGARVTDEN